MQYPLHTPAERFTALIAWLTKAVADMSGGDRLSYSLIGHIIDRLRTLKWRVLRIAARVQAGTYVPRRYPAERKPATVTQPKKPSNLPTKFGWLLPLVPDAIGYRSQLQNLLNNPEMAALVAAAPTSLAQPLRSLCHMLGLRPPDIRKLPKTPCAPRKLDQKTRAGAAKTAAAAGARVDAQAHPLDPHPYPRFAKTGLSARWPTHAQIVTL